MGAWVGASVGALVGASVGGWVGASVGGWVGASVFGFISVDLDEKKVLQLLVIINGDSVSVSISYP